MTPVVEGKGSTQGKRDNSRGQCRGSIWGRGISRGTNRGRGRGHGQGTGQTNKTQERTATSGNQDGNDGNQVQDNGGQYFGLMVPMEVEDEFLKTKVPTLVMYHKSFQHCEAKECCYHYGKDCTDCHRAMAFGTFFTVMAITVMNSCGAP